MNMNNGDPSVNEDLTEAQVDEIRNLVGGEERYATVVAWAADNLTQSFLDRYDQLIKSAKFNDIKKAILEIEEKYVTEQSNNKEINEGKIISSKKRLKGEDLQKKVNELGNTNKSDLAIACGYVDVYEDGKEVINFEEFYEALLDM